MKVCLTIAGSDSGGGAGIQADLKTFHQFGVFGTSAIVAVTAQNTRGVRAIHAVPSDIVAAQLDALAEDLPPAALKTGMLAESALVNQVADTIARHHWAPLVVDPVMVASSGDQLLSSDAVAAVRDSLLPLARLVTPNLDEAEILTGAEVRTPAQMEAAGRRLLEFGPDAVLIKGGHLSAETVTDVLVSADGVRRFTHPRIATRAGHGTGCTLSAAITAGLALDRPLEAAVVDGLEFVQRALATAPDIGSGVGPLNHSAPAPTPG